GGTGRMTVRVTPEGRRVAAILGYLQPLRVRPGQSDDAEWVTATCRMRSVPSMAVEVLALGPHVEGVAPDVLRAHVADLARRTSHLYGCRSAGAAVESSYRVPPISLLRPVKIATTSSPTVTSTSYTPSRPVRSRSVAVATSRSPRYVGRRNRISAPA